MTPPPRPRSAALMWLLVWVGLIVYASWFPFEGWTVRPGTHPLDWLQLPWPIWRDRYDEVANLVGYIPMGALTCALVLHRRWRGDAAVLGAVALALLLSYTVEAVQFLIPSRVPSAKDTVMNGLGAALGAGLALALDDGGWLARWRQTRARWFERHSAVALTLMLLWPVGLLFPAAVPLGLGYGRAEWAHRYLGWLQATPVQPWVEAWVRGWADPLRVLAPEHELTIVVLGLLAPCLLAYAMTVHVRRRLQLSLGALALAVLVTTLSTALSFGPDHAMAWVTPNALTGLAVGMVVALLCVAMPMRACAQFGVLLVAGLIIAVWYAPTDPYFAASLSTWERGRFIRFHGLARWVGWLWPYAVLIWLLKHAWSREAKPKMAA